MNWFEEVEAKRGTGMCCVKMCRKKSSRGYLCRRCTMHRYKERNPVAYCLNKLRCSAKRRGHTCGITLAQLTEFFEANPDLYTKTGRDRLGLTIDRKIATIGYEQGNLQVLTNSENGRKAHVDYLNTPEFVLTAPDPGWATAYPPGENPFGE